MITAALGVGAAGGLVPATAQARPATLTLANGVKLAMDVPDGTPIAQILPPGGLLSGLATITYDAPAPLQSTGGLALPGVSSASTPTTLPAGPAAPSVVHQAAQKPTGRKHAAATADGQPLGSPADKTLTAPDGTAFRTPAGLPTGANPTLTLAPLGPIPIGVPDFFIEKFQIPPFLIPIYQAAGVEYEVPWQVLAAINEIETDYGRNLSVSSAGALGWMQFLPETWKEYGVDANGDGVKDPYNPVDAIFGAARYLHAAGASQSLRNAILAYNHASWYADSVELRAKLIGGVPSGLVASITGLTDGLFPLHAAARYADDVTETTSLQQAARAQGKPAPNTASAKHTTINIYGRAGSPVVAVHDGVITGIGTTPGLGKFVRLRDAYGNTYTYSQLAELSAFYAVPKPQSESAAQVKRDLKLPSDPAPSAPASAGHQGGAAPAPAASASVPAPPVAVQATDTPSGASRLFAHPTRKAVLSAGGASQIQGSSPSSFSKYFVGSYGLKTSDVVLRSLVNGAHVITGAILGRIGKTVPFQAPHLGFQIRPSGKGTPLIDPKPILDGWKLLESTAIYRAAAVRFGSGANSATIGQILLESKSELQQQVLANPLIDIYACGRRDIQAGLIDQRVLAVLQFLATSGLKPGVTALRCGNSLANTAFDKTGNVSDLASGNGVDISSINGITVLGHQGPGSITDIAIRRLLTLQGSFKPAQIVSLMTYPSTDNSFGESDHAGRIHIGYATVYDPKSKFGKQVDAALKPNQWLKLITRLGQIDNPTVAAAPSTAAIPATSGN